MIISRYRTIQIILLVISGADWTDLEHLHEGFDEDF